MKATGIVRRVDDLGRVVIPKEIRKNCCIREGDPLEIYVDTIDGMPAVCFRRYETGYVPSLVRFADRIDNDMMGSATNEQRNKVRNHFNEIAKILADWEES